MNCYLCGKSISESQNVNTDHIPPSGFFISKNPEGVIKLDVHKKCHFAYNLDEQYVINIIRGTGNWDPTAELIWEKRGKKHLLNPKRLGLVKKIANETKVINGLPVTQVDIQRVSRVLNKIVKGLYYSEYSKTLESDGLKLDDGEFLHKQSRWNVKEPSSVSIGDEFKYFKRHLEIGSLEYNLFFYNIHYFRILYAKDKKG